MVKLGNITFPIFTRMNDVEIQIGELVAPAELRGETSFTRNGKRSLTGSVTIGAMEARMVDLTKLIDTAPRQAVATE